MKRILGALGVLALLLLAALLFRAATFSSRQVEVEPVELAAVDVEAAARRLAAGLRFRTISHQEEDRFPTAEFDAFAAHFASTYPRAHAALELERVAGQSLLYTWRGSDPSLRPGLLAAHHDVVPIEPGTETSWTHPPFGGVVADGFVWGRGAMDDKGSVFLIFEAVEALLARGFAPKRTLYIAYGHDEELGGEDGAAGMAELLRSRGVTLEFVLDEGGVVAEGMLAFLASPVAVVGIAEKGSVSIGLTVEVEGGHSSTPPETTAVGILATAVHRLERNPMPTSLDGPTSAFLDHLGPELPFGFRIAVANRWLLGGLVARGLAASPASHAMIRTTTAATIFRGGVKANVLPAKAEAVVNFRILPGDTVESVVEHVRRVVDDDRIAYEVGVRSEPREPSRVSSVESESFRTISRTIREVFPGVTIAPYLVVGGTDARHYHAVCDDVYRFGPYAYAPDDLPRVHGTNERLSLENVERGVQFFVRLVENAAS